MSLERYGAPVFDVYEIGDIACTACANQDGHDKTAHCSVYPDGGKPRRVFEGEPCDAFVPFSRSSGQTR